MYILDLSYKNLPRHLKACFLYLGSYPEDHIIARGELVRRWVAEGFVSSSAGQDVWDVAESYFSELVNRSMLQPRYEDYIVEVSSCKVHDMLLDLIVRRCKEDNFLHLVNEPEAVEEVRDEVIHRLTIVGLTNQEDDIKVPITLGQNLSQIRSLTILGKSNWTPLLLGFKFLRVLCIGSDHHEIKINMTCINQLSQLRYLNVRGSIMPPCQIQGLRLLETLELYRASAKKIALEIADVPHLCHLVLWCTGLTIGSIGKLKSLHTLHNFILPINPLESIIGIGQLTALSDLGFTFPTMRCAPLEKAACMEALSTSLEKLSNLRKLCMASHEVAWRADVLSSLSPTFHNIEELNMIGCTFSRVPRWIGHLQNLRKLRIGVKQMVQEDFAIIGKGTPSLLKLNLWIVHVLTERIVISSSMGFASVKYFEFNCDCISYLSFEAGAMPELQELKFVFDANEWDKATPGGLQHLPSLKKIRPQRSCYDTAEWWRLSHKDTNKVEVELIRGVFQKAADALPTCPTFVFEDGWLPRPVEEEEEEYLNVLDQ